MDPVLLVHGGAWAIPDDMVEAHLNGVRNAMAAGWRVLNRGGSSLDAVEEAVVVMEDDETFDAGRGSFLNRDGKVQLDALIMEGATLRAGGVGCVERLRNPVRAARKILSESPHVYFVAEGAERFAAEHGIALCKNEDLIIPREVERLREFQAHTGKRSPTCLPRLFPTTPWARSPSTAKATSLPRPPPEARSTKLLAAWEIHP
jgi:L-asparaginase / beta-aspartyl-peptidase